MGKAKRAHHFDARSAIDGGHVANAPLPTLPSIHRNDAPAVLQPIDTRQRQRVDHEAQRLLGHKADTKWRAAGNAAAVPTATEINASGTPTMTRRMLLRTVQNL